MTPAQSSFDAIVIGAGAAGLAAFQRLRSAGLDVLCIEARDRIGGRILTVHDPLSSVPVELGAEFIHGRPPRILDLAHSHRLPIYECGQKMVRLQNGQIEGEGETWDEVDRLLTDMRSTSEKEDMPFSQFLESVTYSEEAKAAATDFIEGFNAARREVIGIASLAEDQGAADRIGGDRSFRFVHGYDSLPLSIYRNIPDGGDRLRLNCIVKRIEWAAGSATLDVESALTGKRERFHAPKVIVTVPLGVLQAGSIEFAPLPQEILRAAQALRAGQVIRLVMRFREAFWQRNYDLADAGFLLSHEPLFPTWWTSMPIDSPVLVGWSAGPHADRLLSAKDSEIVSQAIETLAKIVGVEASAAEGFLEGTYLHKWHEDPFSLGAYSYTPAGALWARQALTQPVASTLYFAGEATDDEGHSGTVHGALASGYRAANQVLTSN